MYAPPPYPPYPPFPPPQQRLTFWHLRKLVKSFGPPQSWPEFITSRRCALSTDSAASFCCGRCYPGSERAALS